MPVTITQGNPIPGFPANLNANQRNAAHNLIAQLQFADLWRGPGTLHTSGNMRIDMQGVIPAAGQTPAQQNIQVQTGNLTIAHANVSHSMGNITNPENQLGAVRRVISALEQSLDTGHSFTVTGTIP